MIKFLISILMLILFNINTERKLSGFWESTDPDQKKYLIFNENGSLKEITENQIKNYRYKKNENFIEMELENGSSIISAEFFS